MVVQRHRSNPVVLIDHQQTLSTSYTALPLSYDDCQRVAAFLAVRHERRLETLDLLIAKSGQRYRTLHLLSINASSRALTLIDRQRTLRLIDRLIN